MSRSFDSLRRLFPADQILTEPIDLIPYSFDGTAAMNQKPEAVVFPLNAGEVAQALRWAADHRMPVVTRGSGTSLGGGSIPVPGSLVLCLVRMDQWLNIDAKNLTLLTEPGVTTLTIAEAAEKAGLFYPPDPGSMKISTIGGNVAHNSGGLRGLKYGVTRDYVMALEVVLPNGEIIWTGSSCVKNVAGYSMKDLFVGSEGTLGVITKILLKLIPRPAARQTLLAIYDSMETAAETVSAIIAAPIIPCTLEFIDQTTVRAIEDYVHLGLPTDAQALLLMETDGHPAAVAEETQHMAAIATAQGARNVTIAQTPAEATQLAAARRTAFSALARIAPTTILEDVTVPRSELAKMVRFCQATAQKYQLRMGLFGHMGDGNLHPTFLTNENDPDEMARVEKAMDEMFNYTIALGGTITGEHGVGLAKKKYLPRQLGEANLTLLRAFKNTIDPLNLLNPGKIFDPA